MHDIKVLIRKEMIERRRLMSQGTVSTCSQKICERILASEEYKKASTLLLYKAVNNEVSLAALALYAKRDGKLVAYPACLGDKDMSALIPAGDKDFLSGSYSIPEPDPGNSKPLEPKDIDLVICPLTAFDQKCRRLGMGGGYYDRFLPKCTKAFIAASAYEIQRIDEVPLSSHDICVDAVFTEERVYRRLS